MTIEKNISGAELIVKLNGRLDTTTAPILNDDLMNSISGINKLVLDFSQLEYVSSAGLRVLLAAHKEMEKNGKMIIKNINDTVEEIFDLTGFNEILNIE